jgi:ATP-dependent DNA helicase RecG
VAVVFPRVIEGRKQPESRPESRPESQPESMKVKVLILLADGPMSKSDLSAKLGQKEISGQLNRVIRMLLADKIIEYTIPDKPNSRLQKYRLSAAGGGLLGKAQMKKYEKRIQEGE